MQFLSRPGKLSRVVIAFTLVLGAVLSLVFVLSSQVSTSAHSAGKVYHYGPIHTTNDLDSGTCGNNWAVDAFDRLFSINSKSINTVTENFADGQFVTTVGQSPGACQIVAGPTGNGNMVGDGVKGKFHGREIIVVTGGTFNPKARCKPTTCNTTVGFIATVYGASAQYTVTSFDFDYATPENGGWHNGSADQGGNNGDITGNPGAPHAVVHRV